MLRTEAAFAALAGFGARLSSVWGVFEGRMSDMLMDISVGLLRSSSFEDGSGFSGFG